MTAGDVLDALREQNVQVAAGRIGQPPAAAGQVFQYPITTLGRLLEKDEFEDIIVKTGQRRPDHADPRRRSRRAGRQELRRQQLPRRQRSRHPGRLPAPRLQRPGHGRGSARARWIASRRTFPKGVDYQIVYDTTVFVEESIHEVFKTLFEAIVLVFIVVLVFLQNWRTTIIPMIAVPVSLVGTFAVMAGLGFSLNNLSLFGLVLAIGIVVDDAIVVVENVERNMALGLGVKDATRQAMKEVSGPVVAIALVLCAVFVPTGFITGHHRAVLPPVCPDDRRLDDHLGVQLAHAQPRPLCDPAEVARRGGTAARKRCPGRRSPRWADCFWWCCWGRRSLSRLDPAAVAHGAEAAEAEAVHTSGAVLWGMRGVLFALGAVVGWFLSGPVNALLAALFDGFNRPLRPHHRRLRPRGWPAPAIERRRAVGLCRADGAHRAGVPGRAGRVHPGTGQGLPGDQRSAARRGQPRAHRRGRAAHGRDRP